jgi:hypothetical protein
MTIFVATGGADVHRCILPRLGLYQRRISVCLRNDMHHGREIIWSKPNNTVQILWSKKYYGPRFGKCRFSVSNHEYLTVLLLRAVIFSLVDVGNSAQVLGLAVRKLLSKRPNRGWHSRYGFRRVGKSPGDVRGRQVHQNVEGGH